MNTYGYVAHSVYIHRNVRQSLHRGLEAGAQKKAEETRHFSPKFMYSKILTVSVYCQSFVI